MAMALGCSTKTMQRRLAAGFTIVEIAEKMAGHALDRDGSVWLPIPGADYSVSLDGRVRNRFGRILKPTEGRVSIYVDGLKSIRSPRSLLREAVIAAATVEALRELPGTAK